MPQIDMRMMLEAGLHFGHQVGHWNPKMAPYLYGKRNRIHIIDLEKTLPMFRRALKQLEKMVAEGGVVLFIGTKRAAYSVVEREVPRCGMPYVSRRWLGGALTNFRTVKRSIGRLQEYETMETDQMSKKGRLRHARELQKLRRDFGGLRNMERRPDALFVIDVGFERIAIGEAIKMGIPIFGVVDSNNDPEIVDYPIPGNDDSTRAVQLYVHSAVEAVLQARDSVQESTADEFMEVDPGAPESAGVVNGG